MFRYVLSAFVLKTFSCSSLTKNIYRVLGNTLGARKRTNGVMPEYYYKRVNRMLSLSRRYNVPKNGDNILELGTGWLHWEAITSRLFFDLQGVLFDVWDNRQISGIKNYIKQLDAILYKLDANDMQRDRAHRLIAEIENVKKYEDLYKFLGFKYFLNPSGTLDQLEISSFDVVVSAGVMEHIPENILGEFVQGIANVIKPGGYSIHSISLRDHLYAYDRTVSVKQYLKYSNCTWKRWFENEVQYINRIQRPEWLELFRKAGLVQVEEEIDTEDISGLRVAKSYRHLDEIDLRCCGLRLLHRKPH